VIGFSSGATIGLAVTAAASDRVTVAHLGGALGSLSNPSRRRTRAREVDNVPGNSSSRRLAKTMMGLQRRSLGKNLGVKLATPSYVAFELLGGSAAGPQLPALEDYVRRSSPDDLAAFVEGYLEGADSTDGFSPTSPRSARQPTSIASPCRSSSGTEPKTRRSRSRQPVSLRPSCRTQPCTNSTAKAISSCSRTAERSAQRSPTQPGQKRSKLETRRNTLLGQCSGGPKVPRGPLPPGAARSTSGRQRVPSASSGAREVDCGFHGWPLSVAVGNPDVPALGGVRPVAEDEELRDLRLLLHAL